MSQPTDTFLELLRQYADNDQPEETPTGGGAGLYGEEPAQQQRNGVAPQQPPQQQSGLNDQGHGAAFLPLSPARSQGYLRPERAGLGQGWMPPQQPGTYIDRPHPLTGIMERIQIPGATQTDPHKLWDIQQLEQAEGQIGQRQDLSDQQKQFALNKIHHSMDLVDPQRSMRKDSMLRNMTQAEKMVAQNRHVDKENGVVTDWDAKGVPHHFKIEQSAHAEMMREFESHKMEMQQKHLDQQHAHEQHVMEMQQKMMDMRAAAHQADLDHKQSLLEMHQKMAEQGHADRQAKMDEHSAFWKEYNSEVDKAYKRLTKKGDKTTNEADTPPTKEEVAAHLDEFFPHMRKKRWQIQDEQDKLNPPAPAAAPEPYHQQGPPAPRPPNPFVPSTEDARKLMQ